MVLTRCCPRRPLCDERATPFFSYVIDLLLSILRPLPRDSLASSPHSPKTYIYSCKLPVNSALGFWFFSLPLTCFPCRLPLVVWLDSFCCFMILVLRSSRRSLPTAFQFLSYGLLQAPGSSFSSPPALPIGSLLKSARRVLGYFDMFSHRLSDQWDV